ncbi:MAG TPA: T9SS type A sorting domain-containing protein, partial [Chitinophagaceae bacterium]|nr:T9SS type A sorting domain-containing protein [Chitinophagaceae bacterium]
DVVTVSVTNDLLNKNAIVTDLYGRTLQVIRITSLSFTVSIAQYPAGTYFIKVNNEKPIKVIRE